MRSARGAASGGVGWRRGRNASLVAVALVSVAVVGAPATARAQFSVRPVIAHMSADTGAVTTVQVRNEGAEELQLRFYTMDFDQTEDGGHRFIPAGEHRFSCADRIDVFPDGTTLRPGEIQSVRVRMQPGRDTCWSLVFAETAGRNRTGITIGQRIGVKVYGIPGEAVPQGHISATSVRERDGTATGARLTFENTGSVPVRPAGALEIRTYEGEVVRRVPVEPFSVLPNRVRHLTVPLDGGLPSGRFLAVPVLDFGGDYLAGGQAAFRVP